MGKILLWICPLPRPPASVGEQKGKQGFYNERAGLWRPVSKEQPHEDEWCCSMVHWEYPFAWLLGEGWGGTCMESLVTQESQESNPWFPEMARRSGSLRLPGERAARRTHDWHTFPNLGFFPHFPTCLAAVLGTLISLSESRFPQQSNEYGKHPWIFQFKLQ